MEFALGIIVGCFLTIIGHFLNGKMSNKYENKACSGNCNQGRSCCCKKT